MDIIPQRYIDILNMLFKTKHKPLQNSSLAAVDLGSNSFHMIVAQHIEGRLQIIDRLREMVRLRAGLDKQGNLNSDAQQRALDCLQRFAQRLENIPSQNIRIVGTNTLRAANNAADFVRKAQEILGNPIQIISGIEEARLIYLGVAHSLAEQGQRRLVIDIGGGSTEIIIGERFTPLVMESLPLGCVSMTIEYFENGKINEKRLTRANLAARLELESIVHHFKQHGWEHAVGASGTARSLAKIIQAQGWSTGVITLASLKKLRNHFLEAGAIDSIQLAGLSEDRRPVILGGFIILEALFEALDLQEVTVADGAVREGLIYDLTGKFSHADIRESTVNHLMDRYRVQLEHARNVAATAETLFNQLAESWALNNDDYLSLLKWSACLHEIGLAIAHNDYHKHGAYLAQNSDLAGFSLQEQQFLSLLILTHRQKLRLEAFDVLPGNLIQIAIRLSIILRLAVILHRSHTTNTLPELCVIAQADELRIMFPDNWLASHPLTSADLSKEIKLLKSSNYQLKILQADKVD